MMWDSDDAGETDTAEAQDAEPTAEPTDDPSFDEHEVSHRVEALNDDLLAFHDDLEALDVDVFNRDDELSTREAIDELAEDVEALTDDLLYELNAFHDAGHPGLASVERHKAISLQVAYTVAKNKMEAVIDGEELLPQPVAEEFRDEIHGWQDALIDHTGEEPDFEAEFNPADIQKHRTNLEDVDLNADTNDLLINLDNKRASLLIDAAKEEQTTITQATLRRLLDYGDIIAKNESVLKETIDNIPDTDDIDQATIESIKDELETLQQYFPAQDTIQQSTADGLELVNATLTQMNAANGEHTTEIDHYLHGLAQELTRVTDELVEVNHAQLK